MKNLTIVFSLLAFSGVAPVLLHAQSGLDPADILKPLSDQWDSYSGDMTGKRFSPLKSINLNTIKGLGLKWANTSITTGCGPNGTGPATGGRGGNGGGGRGGGAGLIVAGLGDGESNTCGPARVSAAG